MNVNSRDKATLDQICRRTGTARAVRSKVYIHVPLVVINCSEYLYIPPNMVDITNPTFHSTNYGFGSICRRSYDIVGVTAEPNLSGTPSSDVGAGESDHRRRWSALICCFGDRDPEAYRCVGPTGCRIVDVGQLILQMSKKPSERSRTFEPVLTTDIEARSQHAANNRPTGEAFVESTRFLDSNIALRLQLARQQQAMTRCILAKFCQVGPILPVSMLSSREECSTD